MLCAGTSLQSRLWHPGQLIRSPSKSRLPPTIKVAQMRSQTSASTKAAASQDPEPGIDAAKLQDLEAEDPSFAALSASPGSKGDTAATPVTNGKQAPKSADPNSATLSASAGKKAGTAAASVKTANQAPARGDKAEEPSHSMLDDLIEEDPAFATLNKEDAEESSERVPSIPAAPKNEIPAAAGSEDALAQELDNLKIGKDERDQVGTRNAVEKKNEGNEGGKKGMVATILHHLKGVLGTEGAPTPAEVPVAEPEPLLASYDLQGIAKLIREGRAKKIVIMTGAGISVSAGIPDFRTPGTGLYDNLQKYNLPHPEAVFSMDYFQVNPTPFYQLAKELFPGKFQPTAAHFFLALLHKKGLLLRCYTQNIDSLETQAGVPAEKVIAAHGNFDTAHCIVCRKEVPQQTVREAVEAGTPSRCPDCNGLVKPDIVFFGEALPAKFFKLCQEDFPSSDLLVVMGSSLVVQPFASLIGFVEDHVPRLLINRERVADAKYTLGGFDFDTPERDCHFLGDCDKGVRKLARLLEWEEELDQLIAGAQSVASPI